MDKKNPLQIHLRLNKFKHGLNIGFWASPTAYARSQFMITACERTFHLKMIGLSIHEYLVSTSVHGLRYLAKDEYLLSRIFWTIAVATCVTAASFWIYSSTNS